jgi:hypothetical protein
MKKRFSIITAFLLILLTAVPSFAALQDMSASVMRWSGNYSADGSPGLSRATTGITYKVLAKGSNTAETLYAFADRKLTAKTNPVTTTVFATDGEVRFKVDPTDATTDRYVDLIVTDTQGGFSTFIKNFDKYTHTIVIDERPNIEHHGLIWFTDSTTNEVNTGVNFLAYTAIRNVLVEVVTTEAAGTLDVGLRTYDSDGLRDGVSLATAGYIADTGFITAGTSFDYYPVSTYGTLLATKITGTSTGTAASYVPTGGVTPKTHIVLTDGSGVLVYTGNSAASGAGYIHTWFTRLR